MELSKREQFTKEQLITKAREQIAFCRHTKITGEGRTHVNQCSALFEIALAVLVAEKTPREHRNGWPLCYSDYAAGRNDFLDELLGIGGAQ